MGDLISSLKEFIWDIIGYLIPGFFLVLIFNFCTVPDLNLGSDVLVSWQLFMPFLLIVLSYILGFAVYSLTIFKIRNQDLLIQFLQQQLGVKLKGKGSKKYFEKYISSKHSRYWQDGFLKSSTVTSAKSLLKEEGYQNVDNMKINEMRNILMSRNPEMDEKVYTFMFRSSVFDHISTILLLVCFTALIQILLIFTGIGVRIIKLEISYLIIYLLFILLVPLLGNSKRIFYSISQRIPFSNLSK